MKIKKYTVFSVMLAIIMMLSGCSSAGGISTYTIALKNIPRNLDAQVASQPEEILALTNIYDGLFDYIDGTVQNNLAENYTISQDGRTYTFKIKNTSTFYMKKGDNIPVKAKDFAFSFKRIIDPNTHSPYYDDFKNISNIDTDGDYTLLITLDAPDPNFLTKLCMPAATPCNEEFFNTTKGAYGLGVKNILSNGPFAVNYLADDGSYATIIRVVKSKNGIDRIRLSRIEETITQESLYRDEKISGFFENSGILTDIDGVKKEFHGSNINLAFNLQKPEMQNGDIRKALAYFAFAMQNSGANLSRISQSYTVFTDTITYEGQPINELISADIPRYMDTANPKSLYQNGLSQLGITKLEGYSVLVPSDNIYSVVFENINQIWQKDLGEFFTLEFLPMQEIANRVSQNDYDIAFVDYVPKINSIFTVLDHYTQYDTQVSAFLNAAYKKSGSSALDSVAKAQDVVLQQAYVVPMCKNQSTYWHRGFFNNVNINPFGNVINLKYTTVK